MNKDRGLDSKNTEEWENKEEIATPQIDAQEADTQENEIDIIEKMGWFIRDKSFEAKMCNAEDFLDEVFSLDADEVLSNIEELLSREEFKDIYTIKSDSRIYLFSDKYITKNYADMMVMAEEKNLLKLVASSVRNESKVYPRPTSVKLFSLQPFHLSKEEVVEVLEQLKKEDQYNDIKEIKTSNNALYLYSDKFMTKPQATSIAEWIEVGRYQNP